MTTTVLLWDRAENIEAVEDCHIHGIRDGHLILANSDPGDGLDAVVIREISLADISKAETVRPSIEEVDGAGSGGWTISWGDEES